MTKHIIHHWWKYVLVLVSLLLGYYYSAPVISKLVAQPSEPVVQNDADDSEQVDSPDLEQSPISESLVIEEVVTQEIPQDEDNNQEVISDNTITMNEYTTTDSGLRYKVISEGDGQVQPTSNSRVEVHYHGTLVDGTVFDSSRERGETITFGLNQVIPGWTEGLQLMSVGDVYEFYIPAELAYGDNPPIGSPIQPGSDLIFQVELFDILN